MTDGQLLLLRLGKFLDQHEIADEDLICASCNPYYATVQVTPKVFARLATSWRRLHDGGSVLETIRDGVTVHCLMPNQWTPERVNEFLNAKRSEEQEPSEPVGTPQTEETTS